MNILLTGLRGSGKTSVGQELALQLGRPFVDLDKEIAQGVGKTVEQIVQEGGWQRFRKIEQEYFKKVIQENNQVIATGGGTLVQEDNIPLVSNSTVILLEVPIDELVGRIEQDSENASQRPSLTEHQSLRDEMQALWEEREPAYRQVANLVVDANRPIADVVINIRNQLSL